MIVFSSLFLNFWTALSDGFATKILSFIWYFLDKNSNPEDIFATNVLSSFSFIPRTAINSEINAMMYSACNSVLAVTRISSAYRTILPP